MDSGIEETVNASTVGVRARARFAVPTNEGSSWRDALQHSPVAIYFADLKGRFLHVNERWCELTGLSAEEALGYGWLEAVHPQEVAAVREEWMRCCRIGAPFEMQFRIRRPDGKVFWILGQTSEQRGPDGLLIGHIGTATDITEIRWKCDALQRSHAELEERVRERTTQLERVAMVVASSSDAIVSSDLERRICSWNPAAERIFGYTSREMIGRTTELLTPFQLIDESAAIKQRVRNGEAVQDFETVRVARDGALIEVSLSVFPVRDRQGRVMGTSAIVRDIRERKEAERRLGHLTGRLLQVQDEERRRLARELHDSTAQSLAALAMNLALLNQHADTLTEAKQVELLAQSQSLAETIGREMRTHAYLLHPPLLDERGLSAALGWLVQGFSQRSGIVVRLELDPELKRLPDLLELTIFRVAQECLANIHRHARSSRAEIHLALIERAIVLRVSDAGCGLSHSAMECVGVGIGGMRERLAQVGGTLGIQSSERGTTVLASIPR